MIYLCVAFISLPNSKYENFDPMTRLNDLKAYALYMISDYLERTPSTIARYLVLQVVS